MSAGGHVPIVVGQVVVARDGAEETTDGGHAEEVLHEEERKYVQPHLQKIKYIL